MWDETTYSHRRCTRQAPHAACQVIAYQELETEDFHAENKKCRLTTPPTKLRAKRQDAPETSWCQSLSTGGCRNRRKPLNTTSKLAPMSANTAIHMVA